MNPVFPAMKRLVRILPLFVLAAARAAAKPGVPALPEDGCVRSGVGRVLEGPKLHAESAEGEEN